MRRPAALAFAERALALVRARDHDRRGRAAGLLLRLTGLSSMTGDERAIRIDSQRSHIHIVAIL